MKLSVRPAGALLLIAGLSACEVPTAIPRWETTWITPGEATSVSVAELLPGGLAITPDSSAFILEIDPVTTGFQLSDFCPTCPPTAVPLPKPAFEATVSTDMQLPGAVHSVVISGGEIVVELSNGFDFDPLRPGAASDTGTISIVVTSSGEPVASLVIDGRDQAFAPGTTLTESLAFAASTVEGSLDVEITLVSPAGDPTTMDPSDSFTADISSTGLLVSEATVGVSATPIAGTELELDLGGVDIGDRFSEGTLFLDIENPFSLGGNLTLSIDPAQNDEGFDPPPIDKVVTLAPGSTQESVTFTESEIQQIIGTENILTVSGLVDAVGGAVTVRPDMVISVATRLRVTVEVGGDSEDDSGF